MLAPLISRRRHAATDYSYVPAVLAAPAVMGFEDDPVPANLARTYAGVIALSTVFTRAEWGPVPVMAYRDHLAIDAAVGAAALVSPWVFGFEHNRAARNTFLAMGVMGLCAGLLSDPREMPARRRRGINLVAPTAPPRLSAVPPVPRGVGPV